MALTARIRANRALGSSALARWSLLVSAAHEGRAWEALGYESWAAYCAAELQGPGLGRLAGSRLLRAMGLPDDDVAAVLGVRVPEPGDDARMADPIDQFSGSVLDRLFSHKVVGKRASDVARRRRNASRLRAEGATASEIALELGVTPRTVYSYLASPGPCSAQTACSCCD